MRGWGWAAGWALAVSASVAVAAPPPLSAERITDHVQVLAADDLGGRAVASPGEAKAVAYITDQLKAAGLQPGGDRGPGGVRAWTQAVPLVQYRIEGPISVGVRAGAQGLTWTQGQDVALRAPQNGASLVAVKDAPLVFIGYGVSAPERSWDDYKGVDLKGKIALVLVNDPDFETGQGDFGGKAMTYYGRWTYKFEEAARRGALGVLVIHETEPAAYGWATVKNSNTIPVFDIVRPDPTTQHTLLEGWIQRDVTTDLFRRAGLDFEALKRQAQTRAFKPVALSDVSFSASFAVTATKVLSSNVVGVIRGSKHPDETVIYSAHWDHLGTGATDAKGDAIYNGAVDNAAGVAVLIELARAVAHGPRPERTVVFMSVTAEEQGLLGSEYYAANPLYPLARTVANINTDSPRPTPPARDFSTYGAVSTTLLDDLIAAGKAEHRTFSPDPRAGAGYYYRSDHFSFAKRGVPGLTVTSGEDWISGGVTAGHAWWDAYVAQRYHQPADNFDAKEWRSDGLVADARLMLDLGQRLANSRRWPGWREGAEFKAERDKTADQRR